MKITAVNVYFVRPRWGFVEIVTDSGLVGWGEAVLEGHAKAVLACVEEYRDYLVGKDPSRIEDIWSTIYRAGFYRGGGVMTSALSGIDQALWDIKGKAFNAPCYELMGGRCRDRMKVYSWIGGDRPGDTGRAAKEKMDAGFKAVKMNATEELQMLDTYDKVDAVLARVQEIRDACGKDFGIAVDFHGRVHKPMAKVLAKKLEPFGLMFIEEPVLCEHMEDFKEIAAAADIPIATGERLYTKYDFKRLLNAGGVDIIQPDLSHAGGLTEVKKIASARPHRARGLPAGRRHELQRRHPGAVDRHPLQRGQDRARLRDEQGRLRVHRRLGGAAEAAWPRRGGEQGSRDRGKQDTPQLEEPRLAPC